MAFDPELGYDPEEWELCPPPDHFLAFGWFSRLCLAVGAITFAFLFFYCIGQKKRWSADERRASLTSVKPDPEALEHLQKIASSEQQIRQNGHETSPSSGLRRRQKRLSEQDLQALDEWELERQRLEQTKLEELRNDTTTDRDGAPKTPPSSPPEIQPVDYQRLAADLERRLLDEIRHIEEPTNSVELHQRLLEKHEPEVRRAERSLANAEAEELRKSFTKTLDNAIEQYNRNLNEQVFGNDSDFEQPYKDSPYFYPSDADDAEHAHSFVFESPNAALNQLGMNVPQEPGQVQQKLPSFQQVQDQDHKQTRDLPGQQTTPVPQQEPQFAKKSSSSSDEGFVKIYHDQTQPVDLLKNIEAHREQILETNTAVEKARIQAEMPDFRFPEDRQQVDQDNRQRPDSFYEHADQQAANEKYYQVAPAQQDARGRSQEQNKLQRPPPAQTQGQGPQFGHQQSPGIQNAKKKSRDQSPLEYLEELHDHLLGEAPLNYPGPQGQTFQRPSVERQPAPRDEILSPQEIEYLATHPQVQSPQVQKALERANQENSPYVVVEHDGEVDLYPQDEHRVVKRAGAIPDDQDLRQGQEFPQEGRQPQEQRGQRVEQGQLQRRRTSQQDLQGYDDNYDNLQGAGPTIQQQGQAPGYTQAFVQPGRQQQGHVEVHIQGQQQKSPQQQLLAQPANTQKVIFPGSHSVPYELDHEREQQGRETVPPYAIDDAAKDLDSQAEAQMAELLQEYDVPVEQLKRREQREHVPSPEANIMRMKLKEQGVTPGQGTPVAERRPSKQGAFDHRSATQPPNELQQDIKKRERSEQPSRTEPGQPKRSKTIDGHEDDPRRQVEADIYLQDAMEYVDTHKNYLPSTSGFVIEEDMLESDKQPIRTRNASADPTSRQVPTNEAFDKHEMVFDDADDAVTYAPEIQSVEIPPDQISQASSQFAELPDDREIAQHLKQKEAAPPHFVNEQDNLIHRNSPKNFSGPAPVGMPPAFSVKVETDNVSISSRSSRSLYKQSSLLSALGVTSMQEMLLELTSFDQLAEAMRKAGLERVNLIFGVDYTASNKYQGENSFDGRSLHYLGESYVVNPYQKVITTLGRALAPFATLNGIPVYGFGDNTCGDWGVFPLNGTNGYCKDLDDVLKTYNEVTPTIGLSGPTNFAPLIYQAIQICQRVQDYHVLVIIADGQVTNERATRKAIVQACQWPLSIIVVGVGDGPWEMMRVFDESLPKRPWDNFHFVEFHDLVKPQYGEQGELAFAIHSLLEVPDQYHHITKLGMLPARTATGSRRSSVNR
ncbi:unnamed protein product [Bursaphelenchus xylophilus]|uniref:(pine wood nematode) hypothetical protein n=1 Tax=Bursaphelenchus xylophilus TaxID=6326 RepID=A0A1I7SXA2_BURXY|nr:unnamed protein product [Bursaphelenchus xylophilus]CAG9100282.1 unnamed protein product [Bursaphelenchus xylophilus]